jgi:CHAD domain-containing protein
MLEVVRSEQSPPQSLLKEWLLADLAEARRVLEASDIEQDRAIHLARRRLKRVRTLFEVVKSVAGTGHAHRAAPVKDVFKRLSGHRDAAAMLLAAQWLAGHASTSTSAIATTLVERLTAHVANLHAQPVPISDCVRLLRIAEAEVAALADVGDPRALLVDRLTAIYAKGRKLFRKARDKRDPDDETLHDWRKQVKHRLHISQLVESCGLLKGPLPTKELDHLGEYLGEEHDFANLGIWICADPVLSDQPHDFARLTNAISRRRLKLADRALELGDDLYSQRPSRFEKALAGK